MEIILFFYPFLQSKSSIFWVKLCNCKLMNSNDKNIPGGPTLYHITLYYVTMQILSTSCFTGYYNFVRGFGWAYKRGSLYPAELIIVSK